jgi:hypothetical protein
MVNHRPTSKLFVKVGDGRRLTIAGIGKIRALLQHKGSAPTPVKFHNVHHVPQITVNLLSVASMDDHGLTVVMRGGKCVIRNQQQRVIGEAHKDETRHYRLTTLRCTAAPSAYFHEHRLWSGKTSAGRGGPTGISADILDTNDTSRTALNPLSILPNEDQDDDEDDNGNQADEQLHHGDHLDAVEQLEDKFPLPEVNNLSLSQVNIPQLPHELDPTRDHGPGSRIRAGMRDHIFNCGSHDTPSVQLNSRLRSFLWAKHRDYGSVQFTSASDEASKWQDSRQAEMDSLLEADTYSLVPRPAGVNVVGCKWIDKEKLLPDGSVKLKSRLVAQGFTQQPGVDFYETYSPTVRLDSLRGLLALAAHYDWEIHHMDVRSCLFERQAKRDYLYAST